jgi:hypothetical protein
MCLTTSTSGVSFSSFIPLMFEVPMRRATGFVIDWVKKPRKYSSF